jgi:hypothetical protein
MSTETDTTQWSISISIGNNNDSGGTLNFYAADGYTDAIVGEIYQALAGLTAWPLTVWPGSNWAVSKSGQASTSYATGYSTVPVTFS